jgi:hypothetical protein
MQTWEYLFLRAAWRSGWKIDQVNGVLLEDWDEGPSMYDYINRLGSQGWEMISMQYFTTFDQEGEPISDDYENYRFVLKRPISS